MCYVENKQICEEELAHFCKLSPAKKLLLFEVLVLSCICRIINLSPISGGNPGVNIYML